MDRKHPNGRYTAAFKAHVLEWVEADNARTPRHAGREFDIRAETVTGWERKASAGGISRDNADAPAPFPRATRPSPRGRAPVDTLAADEKARLIATVQDLSSVVQVGANLMAAHLVKVQAYEKSLPPPEVGDAPVLSFRLDRDTCGALLSLSKTASQMVDTYPGLMTAAGIKEETAEGTRSLERVARALGLK